MTVEFWFVQHESLYDVVDWLKPVRIVDGTKPTIQTWLCPRLRNLVFLNCIVEPEDDAVVELIDTRSRLWTEKCGCERFLTVSLKTLLAT